MLPNTPLQFDQPKLNRLVALTWRLSVEKSVCNMWVTFSLSGFRYEPDPAMLLLRPTAGVAAMTALAHPSNLPAPAAADLSDPALLDLAASSTLTLADVLAALPNAGSTTSDQQQEMASAVRTIARLLGEDPTRIPANRRALTRRMASIAPLRTASASLPGAMSAPG